MQQHCVIIFETLQALLKHWQYLFQKEAKRKRDERLRSYRKYQYVANKSLPPQSFVDVSAPHEETDITANIEKIDNRIREYWTSIWTKPAWDRTSVEDLFLDAVEPGVEIALEPITTGDVSAAIKRAKGVGGADGWSAQELKNASPLYDQLASIYNCMEAAGIVPLSLVGDITLIPKAGGSITYQFGAHMYTNLDRQIQRVSGETDLSRRATWRLARMCFLHDHDEHRGPSLVQRPIARRRWCAS